METIEKFLNKFISPIAQKMSENDTIQSIAEGFMRTGPVTFGVCFFAILANLPFTWYADWLKSIGIYDHMQAVLNASLNILALYVSFSLAYSFAKRKNDNALSCGFLGLLSFLVVIPQTVIGKDGVAIAAFQLDNLGGNGILVALIISLLTAHIYHALSKKGLKFKMPDGVPPMVSESIEPIFISMIVVLVAFAIRVGFGFTPYGDFLNFFSSTIGDVLIKVGLSVPTILILYFVANLLWFFGIHPNTVYAPFVPLQMTLIVTNMKDLAAGEPLTYLTVALVSMFASFGGNGNTVGLAFCMLRAKSKRYKQLNKVAFIPNLFNINEPMIFGFPLMLNPTFFIPMVFSSTILGLLGLFAMQFITFDFNPSMSLLPFTTPFFVRGFLAGGIKVLVMLLLLLVVNIIIYYPFFKIADKKACEEEQAALEAEKGELNEAQ